MVQEIYHLQEKELQAACAYAKDISGAASCLVDVSSGVFAEITLRLPGDVNMHSHSGLPQFSRSITCRITRSKQAMQRCAVKSSSPWAFRISTMWTVPFGSRQKSQRRSSVRSTFTEWGYMSTSFPLRALLDEYSAWHILYASQQTPDVTYCRNARGTYRRGKVQADQAVNRLLTGAASSLPGREHPNGRAMGTRSHTHPSVGVPCAAVLGAFEEEMTSAQGLLYPLPMRRLTKTFGVIEGGLSRKGDNLMSTLKSHETSVKSRPSLRSKNEQTISYRTLPSEDATNCTGTFCATSSRVAKRKEVSETICPISNIPPDSSVEGGDKDGGIPTRRDLRVYRLQNENLLLRHREKVLLAKLSRCLVAIVDTEQFFANGLHYDQWETLGELMRRKAKLRGTREMILDINAEVRIDEEDENELRKKLGL